MPHVSPIEEFPKPRPRSLSRLEKQLVQVGKRGDDLVIAFQKTLLRSQTKSSRARDARPPEPESKIDLSFYQDPRLFADPSLFYKEPGEKIAVSRKQIRKLRGGVHERLWFESRFETAHPDYRDIYKRYEENQTAHAHYWRHKGQGHPTLLIIHGWMGGRHRIHEREFLMPWLYRLGLDIVFFQQPFHGRRTPKQARFSGQLHPSTNPARTNEAFAQAVYDLRSLMGHLKSQEGAGPIGATGSSLGGYVTALLASAEKGLDFAIPIIPPAAISELFWEQGKGSPRRREAEKRGVTKDIFRKLLAINSPLALKPLVPPERRFIVAGLGDRLVPPSHPYALWMHWDRCRIHWYPGGHIAQFRRGLYFREIRDFLQGQGVISQRTPR